jgi:hypothetical protein
VKEDGAKDDSGVINDRGEGLVQEDFADLQARTHDTANEEEQLRWNDNARHGGAEGDFCRVAAKTFISEQNILGRKDFGQQNAETEHKEHGGEDDGERAVAPFFVAGFAIAIEDGDERDGGCATDEEIGEQIGEFKRCAVGVLRDSGAEQGVDVFDADEGKDTGEHRRKHEQEGSGEDAVGCGRAKEGE